MSNDYFRQDSNSIRLSYSFVIGKNSAPFTVSFLSINKPQ